MTQAKETAVHSPYPDIQAFADGMKNQPEQAFAYLQAVADALPPYRGVLSETEVPYGTKIGLLNTPKTQVRLLSDTKKNTLQIDFLDFNPQKFAALGPTTFKGSQLEDCFAQSNENTRLRYEIALAGGQIKITSHLIRYNPANLQFETTKADQRLGFRKTFAFLFSLIQTPDTDYSVAPIPAPAQHHSRLTDDYRQKMEERKKKREKREKKNRFRPGVY